MSPKVSVVIPSKDRPALLERAVTSALECLGDNGEVVIADDRSDPPVEGGLLHGDDARVRVAVSTNAPGVSGARNFGVSMARNEIVLFLDDDDELVPGFCDRIIAAASNGRAGFGYSARLLIDNDGSERAWSRDLPGGRIGTSVPFSRWTTGLCGLWVRREIYDRVGGLDERLRTNEDTDFCLRLASAGVPGIYDATPGVRIHAAEHSSGQLDHVTTRTKAAHRAEAFANIATAHADYLAGNPSANWFIRSRAIKHAARAGGVRAGLLQTSGVGILKSVPALALAIVHGLNGGRGRG